MQTVALKPKRAEWTALIVGLVILCAAMMAIPALCVPLALVMPLLACPLVGRKEEPLAWVAAAVPVIASLIAGFDVLYAISLMLIGGLPLWLTRMIALPKRAGPVGMVLYIAATAFSLVVVLTMATRMLGGPLQYSLAQAAIEKLKHAPELSELLYQLATMGLLSVPEGYTAQSVVRPLMEAAYQQQMLMSLRLTLEMLLAQYLPSLFVQSCVIIGVFTALRLDRMAGMVLVVEAKTPSQKHTRVIAPPSFRLLAIPRNLRMLTLGLAVASLVLLLSQNSVMQIVGQLCYATFQTMFTLLGAAVLVFLYTKNDPDRKTLSGILAAAVYVMAPFVLFLIGLADQSFHFRHPQAHKPD